MKRLMLLGILAVTLTAPLLAGDYRIYYFPTGYSVNAINALGQVIGTGNGQVFLWSRTGGFQYLGNESGGTSVPVAINDSGEILGQTTMSDGTIHIFLWTPTGGFQDPPSPLGGTSRADAFNSTGNVAADSSTPDGNRHHAFFWSQSTGSVDIGTLNGDPFSQSNALNNKNEVVGISTDNLNHETAFRWTISGGVSALPGFGGTPSWPFTINDSGEIAGFSSYTNSISRAALWDASGNIHDLGTLAGDTTSGASFINASGHIVGRSDPSGHYFFWTQKTGMTDIGAGALNGVSGLNNRDQIVAQTLGPNSVIFLWSPTLGIHPITSLPITMGSGPNDSGVFSTRGGSQNKLWTPVMQVSLSSSQNPSTAGQSVTFTAAVSAIVGLPPNGEQITFYDNGNRKLCTSSTSHGVASCTTSTLSTGTHNISAKYAGDGNYYPSTSKVLSQVVNP